MEDLGRTQVREALVTTSPENFVRDLGWHGFLWVIQQRLDTIYPADLFRTETYGVNWRGEHAGEDIDPGVRWATLLRLALDQLPEPVA